MLGYVIRRALLTIPVVAIVAAIVFAMLYFTPGDPALVIAGDQATPAQIERIRVALHLDQPPYVRFFAWIGQFLQGDLGVSVFTGQPVTYMIAQRLEPTLSLVVLAVLISVGVGVPAGVIAAWRQGGTFDKVFVAASTFSFSVPVFISAYGLAYIFATTLGWLPVQGFSPIQDGLGDFVSRLIMPAIAISMIYATLIANVTRSSMLDVLGQDYIRTAITKGVPRSQVLFRHALKNAAIPVITVVGNGIGVLIGGTVIIETIFAIPGIGRLTVDAIMHRDYPVIQGVVLLSSIAYVLLNLIVDLTYVVFDPRVRY